jgi:hypothetical protein
MRRTCAALFVCLLIGPASGFAADGHHPASLPLEPLPSSRISIEQAPSARGTAVSALSISLAALQAYDVFSTTTALRDGGVESNPIMKGIAGNPLALTAVKAGTTTATIYLAHRLWRRNRRVEAIALMAITNGLMAGVALHNASVVRRLGR